MQKAIRLVTRFLAKCQKDKINAYSAQIAFFIILSIIPFLMVFSSMLQYTSITEDMVFEIIERVMPQYVAPFLVTLVKEIYTRSMGNHFGHGNYCHMVCRKRHSVYGRWSECGSRIKRDKKLVCTPILGGYLYHCFSGCDCIYACCAGFWKQSAAFSGRLSSVYCTSRKNNNQIPGAYHVTSSDPVF